ncbi:hypothetical protein WJX75_008302 [Coccomyxa subellipsoidea]|uniref:Uncharacterized protein n=1 Tax=Coccomyxa subellipsoidea TaxID=248742 RepID=A0ABR2YAL7_9CHLO
MSHFTLLAADQGLSRPRGHRRACWGMAAGAHGSLEYSYVSYCPSSGLSVPGLPLLVGSHRQLECGQHAITYVASVALPAIIIGVLAAASTMHH